MGQRRLYACTVETLLALIQTHPRPVTLHPCGRGQTIVIDATDTYEQVEMKAKQALGLSIPGFTSVTLG